MADSSTNVPLATYDLIGTWIGQQRQTPAPLTDRLRSALVGLENALKAESVSLSEPEMGDSNWIGLLQGKSSLLLTIAHLHLFTYSLCSSSHLHFNLTFVFTYIAIMYWQSQRKKTP